MKVVLHIDRLALKGFAREDRHAIVAALRQTLARQLAEPGAAVGLSRLPPVQTLLRVGGIGLGRGLPASSVGERLAGGIATGLRR
jgi:hypothetical protein